MSHYYKPSGKFAITSILFFVLLCLTAFPLLGLIYAYCIWYIPFIYVNFLIAAGFGLALGFIINHLVVNKGKVRSVMLAALFGILGGLVALYFHWAVWIDLVINAGESYGNSRIGVTVSNIDSSQVLYLILHPGELFGIMKEVNEFGTWGIKSSTVSGTFLTIIWIVELLIVVGASTLLSFPKAEQPFCEEENTWFEESVIGVFPFINDTESLTRELEIGQSETLSKIQFAPDTNVDHSVFTLYSSGLQESYLSIENKTAKKDKNGELDFDSNVFIHYIAISQELKEYLLNPETPSPLKESKTES